MSNWIKDILGLASLIAFCYVVFLWAEILEVML